MVVLVLLQRRVWLARPIQERVQVLSDAGLSPWLQAFLFCLFISFCWASVSSYRERPCYTVCLHAVRFSVPGVRDNAHGLQISFADVFVAQMRSASGSLSVHKLSVQEILGDPAIVHSDYMSEPAQAYLL